MKKLVKMLMLVLLMLVMTLTNSGVVKAEDSDVEFIDFNYSSTKIRENGKIKVRFSCNWETEEYIIVTGLSYKIRNQSADIYGTKLPKGNKHHIDFVIENWQSGTVELTINYNCDVPDETNIHTKVIYLTTSNWQNEEISVGNAIVLALLATICVRLCTFLIIENTKKEYKEGNN